HRQQTITEIFGEVEETLIARELVISEQAAEQPDGDLEVLDLDVFIEREIVDDVLFSCRCLVVQVHDDHRVEGVDGGHQERLRVPVVICLREWLQIVVSPGVFLVTVPGAQELCSYFRGELLFRRLRVQRDGEEQQQEQEDKFSHLFIELRMFSFGGGSGQIEIRL